MVGKKKASVTRNDIQETFCARQAQIGTPVQFKKLWSTHLVILDSFHFLHPSVFKIVRN